MDLTVFGDKADELQSVLDRVKDFEQSDIEDIVDAWYSVDPPLYDIVPAVAFAESLDGVHEIDWYDLVGHLFETTEAFPFNDTEFNDPDIAKAEYAVLYKLFAIVFSDHIALEDYDDLVEVWDFWVDSTIDEDEVQEDVPDLVDDVEEDDEEVETEEGLDASQATQILDEF